jgi:hypothetical protein
MTSWVSEINYSETELEFYKYCLNKFLEIDIIFRQKHNEGLLNNYEYNISIIWGNNYSIRKEYQWIY